jgi:egghead protein (zeste-white 4 protein)
MQDASIIRVSLIENIIIFIITAFWFSSVPVAFLTLARFLKNRGIFVQKDPVRVYNDPKIIFQITTRSATNTDVVKRGIHSIMSSSLKINYNNFTISVVSDDHADIDTLRDVNKKTCEVIIVDNAFSTHAIKKGRALQYAVEHRRRVAMNTSEYWIFHMDEESYVTSQTVLSLLKFIREGMAIASEGPIFYPLKFESANFLTAIAESGRPFACYHCVSHMTNPPPMHMHGSNLLVRSDVEDSIGWNFGPTLAEDEIFGYKIYEKYGSESLGWHGGVLFEQPPLNIKDHFMQRRRWILGRLQNIDKFPFIHRFKVAFELVTYFLVFVSGIISPILCVYSQIVPNLQQIFSSIIQTNSGLSLGMNSWLFLKILNTISSQSIIHTLVKGNSSETTIGLMLLFSSIVWLLSYQVGLFLNLRYSRISRPRRVLFHLQTLILCPIIGVIETFPAFCAILEYQIKNKNHKTKGTGNYDFYVIKK